VLERLGRVQKLKRAIDVAGDVKTSRFGQNHAPAEFGGIDACDVDGGALAGGSFLNIDAMHLNASHADAPAGGMQFHFLVNANAARDQRSSDNGAESAHGEGAVNGQAKILRLVFGRDGGGDFRDLRAQFVQAGAGGCTYRDHRGAIEERAADEFARFQAHQIDQVGWNQVSFRKDNNALPYA